MDEEKVAHGKVQLGKTGVIIVAAGVGKRMGHAVSKQYLHVGGKPIVVHALAAFAASPAVEAIVLVVGEQDLAFAQSLVEQFRIEKVAAIVPGGSERQHSVRLGLEALEQMASPPLEWVLVHDAARPLVTVEVAERCLVAAMAGAAGAAVPGVRVKDTIKTVNEEGIIIATPERNRLWAVQTPQAFRLSILREAHRRARDEGFLGTDDAMLVERIGVAVSISQGDEQNIKVTTPADLDWVEFWLAQREMQQEMGGGAAQIGKEREGNPMLRVGQGFDVHRFAEGRACIIGGVHIPHERGLLGHSDADVLLHAVADAVLGALALGDIGKHFPDTDPMFKDADSLQLLQHVWGLASERGYVLGNLDCTIIAERPKMAPYIPAMVEHISRALEADVSCVNVKATTTEKLGFPGREEGIAAQAVVCLMKRAMN
jgi:2-C-methyl-D-erythritol 4-phosphate cytidylyltransferase/2-C-methyl-D-erythritol 2,4-cyclodiphosphate synthase